MKPFCISFFFIIFPRILSGDVLYIAEKSLVKRLCLVHAINNIKSFGTTKGDSVKYFFLLIVFFLSVLSGELLSCDKGKKFVIQSFQLKRQCPYCKGGYDEKYFSEVHLKTCDYNPNKIVIRCECSDRHFVSDKTLRSHQKNFCPLRKKGKKGLASKQKSQK